MNNADLMTWSIVGILLLIVTIKIYFQVRPIKTINKDFCLQ